MMYDIFRRAKGFRGQSDFGKVGSIEASSAEEADKLWWELHPDREGLVVGQWAEPVESQETIVRGSVVK